VYKEAPGFRPGPVTWRASSARPSPRVGAAIAAACAEGVCTRSALFITSKRMTYDTKPDDFESAVGPSGYRSPRHRKPNNSQNKGSKCGG